MKKLLEVTLGILTAVGGMIDIGNLVANPQAGARFGVALAWTIPLGVLGIVLYLEMGSRVATVAQRPVFDIVRERLGPKIGLVNLIASFGLDHGEANALTATLDAALADWNRGDTHTARNQMNAFENKVNAQAGQNLTAQQASQLITEAEAAIGLINAAG